MIALGVAALWLLTLLVAIVVPRKFTLAIALVTTLAFAAIWAAPLLSLDTRTTQASAIATKTAASCASIEVGQAEQAVRARLGEPTEVRKEDELRGPGATVWIYRDSRCAVHLLDGAVESID